MSCTLVLEDTDTGKSIGLADEDICFKIKYKGNGRKMGRRESRYRGLVVDTIRIAFRCRSSHSREPTSQASTGIVVDPSGS
jgi:hypothetical protein